MVGAIGGAAVNAWVRLSAFLAPCGDARRRRCSALSRSSSSSVSSRPRCGAPPPELSWDYYYCSTALLLSTVHTAPPKLIICPSATTNTLIRSWLNSLHQRTGTLTSEVVFTTQHLDLIRYGLQYYFSVLLLKGEIDIAVSQFSEYIKRNIWVTRHHLWSTGFW